MLKHYTTDNQSELFDIVNTDDVVVGMAARGEVHANKSLIHRSICVVLFHSNGEILLQQRSETKDTNPLQWTLSCSGHVDAGHTYEEAAKRELQEELGVHVSLTAIKKYIVSYENETEMTMLFKGFCDGPFDVNFTEIKQICFYSTAVLQMAISTNKINMSLSGRRALETLGLLTPMT